jgi:DNA (cytosine-5)-methyltransferase 1
MTFGSLFSGIGGFDLGFEKAGLQCRWQVENDISCQVILEKHWPKDSRREVMPFPNDL